MAQLQSRIDASRLVFIDETWTKTNMAALRGRAPRGNRIPAKVPAGRCQTMTFLAALRHDRLTAPWLIDGPINGERFQLYVEKVLAPALHLATS
jgi:putative transposase